MTAIIATLLKLIEICSLFETVENSERTNIKDYESKLLISRLQTKFNMNIDFHTLSAYKNIFQNFCHVRAYSSYLRSTPPNKTEYF